VVDCGENGEEKMSIFIGDGPRLWWLPGRFRWLDISAMGTREAIALIKRMPGTVVMTIGILPFSLRNWEIYRSCNNRRTAVIALGGVPMDGGGWHRLPWRWLGIEPVDIVFGAGDELNLRSYPIGENTEFIPCHSVNAQIAIDQAPLFTNPLPTSTVFIDPGTMGAASNAVYAELDAVLPKWCHVCLHPPEPGHVRPERAYGDRPMSEGDTVQMIANAERVICCGSTAVSLAHIFRKPLEVIKVPSIPKWYQELGERIASIPREEYLRRFVGEMQGNLWDKMEAILNSEEKCRGCKNCPGNVNTCEILMALGREAAHPIPKHTAS
jgi:hypothetical protein